MLNIPESEYRFCQILWDNEPVSSADLSRICLQELGWKRTTTYTVIRRLCERGIIEKEKKDGMVRSLISRKEAEDQEIENLVQKKFRGSLPAFVAAFTRQENLSRDDLEEIEEMIARIRKGERQ